MEKQIHNMLKKDPSRLDDLLSSYSCSKFQKCSFEKNTFKDTHREILGFTDQSFFVKIVFTKMLKFS